MLSPTIVRCCQPSRTARRVAQSRAYSSASLLVGDVRGGRDYADAETRREEGSTVGIVHKGCIGANDRGGERRGRQSPTRECPEAKGKSVIKGETHVA